jgi:hypothetical protein
MFEPIYIYVPEAKQILKIAEGSGDNLLDEDIDAGYVDYIYYEQYVLDPDMREYDGGMVMLHELFQTKFSSTKDSIPHVLDMACGTDKIPYVMLERYS